MGWSRNIAPAGAPAPVASPAAATPRRAGRVATAGSSADAPNEDVIREDQNPTKCWVDLPSFQRLYPEIAAATDVAATIRLNAEDELPLEQWDGTPVGT